MLLLVPGVGILLVFLVLPLANVVEESIRLFEPGRIGAAKDAPYTLVNYAELMDATYLYYFTETARIGFVSSIIGLILGFPIAYVIARRFTPFWRKVGVGFLIGIMFLSTLVRVYALQLTFGPTGIAKFLSGLLGVSMNGRFYTELVVVLGLLHYLVPIAAITLLGTIPECESQAHRSRPGPRRAALDGSPDHHRAFVCPRAPVGIPDFLHAVPVCVRGADDSRQRQNSVRIQPDLCQVQRNRQLSKRLCNFNHHAGAFAADHLRRKLPRHQPLDQALTTQNAAAPS